MHPSLGFEGGVGGGSRPIPADPDQLWYLTSDVTCWTGLMPHIHGVEVLDRRGDRTLARVDARRGWMPVRFTCGFACDHERRVMHRWYLGAPWRGIVETWRVRPLDDGQASLAVTIRGETPLARLLVRAVIGPIARRQLEMIDLLAVAHRQAQEADGWE